VRLSKKANERYRFVANLYTFSDAIKLLAEQATLSKLEKLGVKATIATLNGLAAKINGETSNV
jgi:hypothetical protein